MMSELLLKFNQLNDFQRQEVMDFLDFLLTKENQKQQNAANYQQKIQEVPVWEEEADDTYNFFDSAGLMENRDMDADQLRRDAWKIKP
jgi:ribulose kinase